MQPPVASPAPKPTILTVPKAASPSRPLTSEAGSETITWRIHLLKDQPGYAVGIFAAALFAAACALFLFHNLACAGVAFLLVLVSVAEYLLPLTYTLDEAGVSVALGPVQWLAMPWSSVRMAYPTSYGMKLSPFDNPKAARLEDCRGICLRIPTARRTEIEAVVTSQLGGDA